MCNIVIPARLKVLHKSEDKFSAEKQKEQPWWLEPTIIDEWDAESRPQKRTRELTPPIIEDMEIRKKVRAISKKPYLVQAKEVNVRPTSCPKEDVPLRFGSVDRAATPKTPSRTPTSSTKVTIAAEDYIDDVDVSGTKKRGAAFKRKQ